MAKAVSAVHPISVRFRREEKALLQTLRARANASKRTLSEQMKYFAHIGIVASDNPDLPMNFIKGVLEGIEESRAGLSVPYEWGILK